MKNIIFTTGEMKEKTSAWLAAFLKTVSKTSAFKALVSLPVYN